MEKKLVKNSPEEKQIAKKALAALTRLRQGGNPFRDGVLAQLEKDEKTFKECIAQLNIPIGYDNVMLHTLKKISKV
jgi:hypothetical protein